MFLLLLLAASLSVNVYLGWEIQHLKNIKQSSSLITLTEGVKLPNVWGQDLNDKEQEIIFNGSQTATILYIFSPACVWCQRNSENINNLSRLRSDSYRFIGLSLREKDLKSYMDSHKLSIPVYKNLSQNSIRSLGLGSTPQTIVISPEGKIIKSWIGAYQGQIKTEIESFFGIKLPKTTFDEKNNDSKQSCESL